MKSFRVKSQGGWSTFSKSTHPQLQPVLQFSQTHPLVELISKRPLITKNFNFLKKCLVPPPSIVYNCDLWKCKRIKETSTLHSMSLSSNNLRIVYFYHPVISDLLGTSSRICVLVTVTIILIIVSFNHPVISELSDTSSRICFLVTVPIILIIVSQVHLVSWLQLLFQLQLLLFLLLLSQVHLASWLQLLFQVHLREYVSWLQLLLFLLLFLRYILCPGYSYYFSYSYYYSYYCSLRYILRPGYSYYFRYIFENMCPGYSYYFSNYCFSGTSCVLVTATISVTVTIILIIVSQVHLASCLQLLFQVHLREYVSWLQLLLRRSAEWSIAGATLGTCSPREKEDGNAQT